MSYFHGGIPGLDVGDQILPPSITGAPASADAIDSARHDRVYLALEKTEAAIYAGGRAEDLGDLYEVAPRGVVEPDVDGISVQCEAATIVRVLRRGVTRADAIALMRRSGLYRLICAST